MVKREEDKVDFGVVYGSLYYSKDVADIRLGFVNQYHHKEGYYQVIKGFAWRNLIRLQMTNHELNSRHYIQAL